MTDRTVLVTGGAQGIGRATVEACLEKGWNAVAMDVDAEALDALGQAVEFLVLARALLGVQGVDDELPCGWGVKVCASG